jgi:hypothetical protein
MDSQEFSIESATFTDVFSFGLLVWEVMKNGESFFDSSWIESGVERDVEIMEAFLDRLPSHKLCEYGLEFLAGSELDTNLSKCIIDVFEGSLQDAPYQREPMLTLRRILESAVGIQE